MGFLAFPYAKLIAGGVILVALIAGGLYIDSAATKRVDARWLKEWSKRLAEHETAVRKEEKTLNDAAIKDQIALAQTTQRNLDDANETINKLRASVPARPRCAVPVDAARVLRSALGGNPGSTASVTSGPPAGGSTASGVDSTSGLDATDIEENLIRNYKQVYLVTRAALGTCVSYYQRAQKANEAFNAP